MLLQKLKQVTPRQSDLNMDALVIRFRQKQLELEGKAVKDQMEEGERVQHQIQEQRKKLIQKFKEQQLKNSETHAKIQLVSNTVHTILK